MVVSHGVVAVLFVVLGSVASQSVGTADLVGIVGKRTKVWQASLSSPVAHLTHAEARGLLGAGPEGFAPASDYMPLRVFSAAERAKVPKSYDPREDHPECQSMWLIRDQSACGSCWAGGSVAAMTDRSCIAEGHDVVLSAEDVLACSGGGGCNGGQPAGSYEYWRKDGVVTEACRPYPFPSCDHHVPNSTNPCPDDDYKTPLCRRTCDNGRKWLGDKHRATNTSYVEKVEDIMVELSTNGPCTATFAVYEDFMVYTSGVYHHVTGRMMGYHAVKLMGYGYDENNTPYWLLANSWNEHWGEKGFFRVYRGKNECGIEKEVMCGLPEKI